MKETRKIIENTLLAHHQRYGYNCSTEVNVKCNVKFSDKIENKTKNIMIEYENIIGKVNKIRQTCKGMIKFIRILELTTRIKGRFHKLIMSAYMNRDNVPIL